jgi:predicted RNA-binding Zn-ribbon protein involved in translation (DUF1610 family)
VRLPRIFDGGYSVRPANTPQIPTHQSGATQHDAEIVLDATHSVIDTFGAAVMRHESGAPDQCPQCGSYALDIGFEPELMPRAYILECENCGWRRQQEEEA